MHRPSPDLRRGPRWRAASMAIVLGLGMGLGMGLTGCGTLTAGGAADPAKLTWAGFLSGDDLRAGCREDGADHYRLVFDVDHTRHIRSYDVVGDKTQGGATVEARALEASDITRVERDGPLTASAGPVSRLRLTPKQYALFVTRLYQAGAFDPAPGPAPGPAPDDGGPRNPGEGVHWVVSGCRRGSWFFNAHPYPTDRFADIRFDGRPPRWR